MYSDPNDINFALKFIDYPIFNIWNVSIEYIYDFTPNTISGISSADSVGSILI